MNNTILGYRVEDPVEQHGLWRNFDGTWNPVFEYLTEGLARSMNMDDDPMYREGGKQWFSAAPTKETLKHWFSRQDVLELRELGYRVYEFELVGVREVSEFEIVFTRDNIVRQTEIPMDVVWERSPEEQFMDETAYRLHVGRYLEG